MAETKTEPLNVEELLLGGRGDVAQCLLLRQAQARSPADRRQLERLVIELNENPNIRGKALSREEAALVVGAGLWALGHLDEAIANLAAAGSPEADYLLGQCYLENGHFTKAAEAFTRAQRGKAATKRQAAFGLIEATAKAGRPDPALADARALARSHPNDAAAHYLVGLCLDLCGRYEDAAPEYEKALKLDPRHPGSAFRLGYVHALRGEEDRALEHYTTLASSTPLYVNALVNLAVLYEDRQDYDSAIDCYRRVLRADPTHPRARMFLKDAHGALDMAYDEDRQRELERRQKVMEIPVDDFELSVRVRNCLQRMSIETLGDLCRMSEEELLASKNFGETSLQEIKEVLQARGLRLGDAREEGVESLAPAVAAAPAGAPGATDQSVLAIPIGELNLSMRSRKCMERLGIATIGQIVEHSAEELLASRNFGRTSLNEVTEKLARYNLQLKQTPPEGEEEDEDEESLKPQEEVLPPGDGSEPSDEDDGQ